MPEIHAPARPHAPLMWGLFPMLAAYGFAEAFPGAVQGAWGALAGLSLVAAGAAIWAQRRKLWRARLYCAVAIFAAAMLYYNAREEKRAVASGEVAPREAVEVIEIRQLFALVPESPNAAGLGVIRTGALDGTGGGRDGERVNFSLRWQPREVDAPKRPEAEVGMWIRAKGVLSPNPEGGEGFSEYLRRAHATWNLSRGELLAIERAAPPLLHEAARLHDAAVEVLHRRLMTPQPGDAGLLPAMVLGDRAELTPTQKENFVRSGTMHLVAVSGMNLMAVAAVLWVLLRATGIPRVWQAAEVAGALLLYTLVTGAGASVWRAWGMVALGLLAWALRRKVNLWAIIVLAATLSLVVEPLSFLHAGWRLSFGVVSGLVLGMGAVERWGGLERLRGVWKGVAETCVVSLVAGLAVAPMTAAYWGMAQPLGFLVNAVAVTLASGITVLGTVSWLVCWVPHASAAVNEVAYWLIRGIDWAIGAYLKLPGACVEASGAKAAGVEIWGTLAVLGIFYALARWGWRRTNRRLEIRN